MNNKFDKVIFSYIEENINVNIDQERLKKDLQRVSSTIPVQARKALEATSDAMSTATETDPIQAKIKELENYKSLSPEQRTKIAMELIDLKVLPDITGKTTQSKPEKKEENTEENSEEENQSTSIQKPIKKTPLTSMSANTYKAPI